MNLRTIAEEIAGGHYDDDDCWYSCPLCEHGCCDDEKPRDVCTCGREERIARIMEILEQVYKAGASNEPLEG